MKVSTGDRVEWTSCFSDYVFRGVVEGFFGKERKVAFCTDQTGRPSRPVAVDRLRRAATTHWYQSGRVA
jgi:hypothetical protein